MFTLEFAFIYLDAQDPNSSDFYETLSINTAHVQNHDNITINIIVTSPLTLIGLRLIKMTLYFSINFLSISQI